MTDTFGYCSNVDVQWTWTTRWDPE